MRLEYKEADIETVFKYYVEGFTDPNGGKIVRYNSFYDPRNGKVMFELYVEYKPKE